MDAQQFAYWLQGFAELSGDAPPTKAQWKSIREHLGLVFKKVTPLVDFSPDMPREWWKNAAIPASPWTTPRSPTCAAGKLPPSRSECSSGAIAAYTADAILIC